MNQFLADSGTSRFAPHSQKALASTLTDQPNIAPSLSQHELIALVNGALRPRRALRVADMPGLTGDSRSQLYARINPKYRAYDASFPKPFYVGQSPRFWEHEVIAWLESRASANSVGQ